MSTVQFLSGNEAVAHAVRLCKPRVIAAYPITPQTIVVERLAEMVESKELEAEYVHVESEHSALSLVMGAAAMGVRTFTATSSQGLLYMSEVLFYASGGRFPLVMMNANRALALPWNIYGDQSDSLSLLSSGWIQAYAETAQEALEMTIQAYAVAENRDVLTPVMVNLDGFVLTHTYESVTVPDPQEIDSWLPEPDYPVYMNLDTPISLAMTAGPGDYTIFKYRQHRDMVDSAQIIEQESKRWAASFGGTGSGLIETYRCDDADTVVVTLGSIAGLVRETVDSLRKQGVRAGLLRIRYLRPFPTEELLAFIEASPSLRMIGVFEKALSTGNRGPVATEIAALLQSRQNTPTIVSFIGGLGGQDVGSDTIEKIFSILGEADRKTGTNQLIVLGMEEMENDYLEKSSAQ